MISLQHPPTITIGFPWTGWKLKSLPFLPEGSSLKWPSWWSSLVTKSLKIVCSLSTASLILANIATMSPSSPLHGAKGDCPWLPLPAGVSTQSRNCIGGKTLIQSLNCVLQIPPWKVISLIPGTGHIYQLSQCCHQLWSLIVSLIVVSSFICLHF